MTKYTIQRAPVEHAIFIYFFLGENRLVRNRLFDGPIGQFVVRYPPIYEQHREKIESLKPTEFFVIES